jgi:hypothetical protein
LSSTSACASIVAGRFFPCHRQATAKIAIRKSIECSMIVSNHCKEAYSTVSTTNDIYYTHTDHRLNSWRRRWRERDTICGIISVYISVYRTITLWSVATHLQFLARLLSALLFSLTGTVSFTCTRCGPHKGHFHFLVARVRLPSAATEPKKLHVPLKHHVWTAQRCSKREFSALRSVLPQKSCCVPRGCAEFGDVTLKYSE